MRTALALVCAAMIAASATGAEVKLAGSVRLRGEAWRWFETPGFDDQYAFAGSLIRFGLRSQSPNYDWQLELAQPGLWGLPDNAVAPPPHGQLGFGATYFAANQESNATGLFIKQGWLRLKRGNLSGRIGRFEFIEGAEVAGKNAVVAELERERIAHRLIGNFGFTHVGRSFDGLQLSWTRGPMVSTFVAARPTAGAFTVEGNEQLREVELLYGSFIRAASKSDARLFAIAYRDQRDGVKTDNRPAASRRADLSPIEIITLGGHYVGAVGNADLVAWGATQFGEWGLLDHHASAIDLELGYHWRRAAVRAGAFRGSGDSDPSNGDHETFFQILPTPRLYARFPFYNLMNSRDLFLILSVKPSPRLTVSAELHQLRLSSARDLWYSGGGAFDETSFGYAGRPSGGRDELARVLDLSIHYALGPATTVAAYFATADGHEVIRTIYPTGSNARYGYVEVTRRFETALRPRARRVSPRHPRLKPTPDRRGFAFSRTPREAARGHAEPGVSLTTPRHTTARLKKRTSPHPRVSTSVPLLQRGAPEDRAGCSVNGEYGQLDRTSSARAYQPVRAGTYTHRKVELRSRGGNPCNGAFDL